MKITYFLFLCICIPFVFSCEKEQISKNELEHDIFNHLSKSEEIVSFNGESMGKSVRGFFKINEEKKQGKGELFIDGEKYQNFIIDLKADYLNQIDVQELGHKSYKYTNVMEGGSATIKNLSKRKKTSTGKLLFSESVLDISITESAEEIDLRNPIVWAVIAGVGATVTIVTCAVERSAARANCMLEYSLCNSECYSLYERACNYNYTSGVCGGQCSVSCSEY